MLGMTPLHEHPKALEHGSIPRMKEYKVGQLIVVKLSAGRIVGAEIKAIRETTEGVRYQVSFENETALIYEWQIVKTK